MNTKSLTLLLLISIFACSNKQANRHTSKQTTAKIASSLVANNKNNNPCIECVINDSIIYNLLAIKTFVNDSEAIRSVFKFPPKIYSQKNKGIDDYVYETLTYKLNDTKLIFLKNDGGYYLTGGVITNENVLLRNNCCIGIDRKEFLKNFKFKNIICDTIQVCNQDQTYMYSFIFDNTNKLSRIVIHTES